MTPEPLDVAAVLRDVRMPREIRNYVTRLVGAERGRLFAELQQYGEPQSPDDVQVGGMVFGLLTIIDQLAASTPTRAATDAELCSELAATATWINAQAGDVGVHLDRMRRAIARLSSSPSSTTATPEPNATWGEAHAARVWKEITGEDLATDCERFAKEADSPTDDARFLSVATRIRALPSSRALSEEELATIAVVRKDVARGLTTYAAQSRILLGILDRLTGAHK
jgi:hypothetical protein